MQRDLLVSTKKYNEVESFFTETKIKGNKTVLFLLGGSGSGKKTLISFLLEKKFGYKVSFFHRLKKLEHGSNNKYQEDEENHERGNFK